MHEPYVNDAAEPPARPLLAAVRPAVAVIAAALLLVALATLFLQGRGQQDPSLRVPTPAADS